MQNLIFSDLRQNAFVFFRICRRLEDDNEHNLSRVWRKRKGPKTDIVCEVDISPGVC